MNSIRTLAIVLSRLDYGEADRIITVITSDQGKLSLMAKGVRRLKSKLAGGVELFSVNDISFLRGRGEIGTLISARNMTNYSQIIKDIEKVQTGYEILKIINKNTEQHTGEEYFNLVNSSLAALNETSTDREITLVWFKAHLLNLAGHMPNLTTDKSDQNLSEGHKYTFDFENMCFSQDKNGKFTSNEIKMTRIIFASVEPSRLNLIKNSESHKKPAIDLINSIATEYLT